MVNDALQNMYLERNPVNCKMLKITSYISCQAKTQMNSLSYNNLHQCYKKKVCFVADTLFNIYYKLNPGWHQ